MENHKEFIAFDLDESLYFEHGQEISEMVSISLDPDITLEMQETYAQLAGVIVLNGTYEKVSEPTGSQSNIDQEQQYKYIEKIVDHHNERTADFYHRFPVDISIPKERVHRLEDVRVQIAAFDYELPDHHTVKLSATIHITGLVEEVEEEVEADVKEVQEEEEVEESLETVDSEVITADDPVEKTEDQTAQTSGEEQIEDVEYSEATNDKTDIEPHSWEETEETEEQAIDISLHKTEQEEDVEQVENVQFLTDLFANSEEEMQTTVTLYISQETDTIESIAKRFEIPTLRLIKDNDLSGEKIATGQLLYIPR